MAYFSGSFHSETLSMKTHITVVFPKSIPNTEQVKVVYLLHGISDNDGDWFKNAQLPMLADDYNLIFIMPEVQRSFYTDMAYGMQYYTYVSEELPRVCKRLFQIPVGRENTYVMGLSMGGYGALKCALKKPEQYVGCGAFSAAADINDIVSRVQSENNDIQLGEMKAVFGTNLELVSENDLFLIAKDCEKKQIKPQIFMTCGTEDFLYDVNIKFRDFMQTMDFDFTYQEWEGVHEWYLWNKSLHLACAHFFSRVHPEDYSNI